MPTNTFREYERIEPISGSEPKRLSSIDASDEISGPSKVKFDEAVRSADQSKVERREVVAKAEIAAADLATRPTPIGLASSTGSPPPKVSPTPKDLEGQASDLRKQMDRPRAILMNASPEVTLSPGAVSKLSGHLEHIDRGLQDISRMTTGVEVGSALHEEKSPAIKFLSFLTESDKRLGNFVDEVKGLNIGKQRLQPEEMFAVQIKLNFVQQELEFFTTTLNKSLESTKTIMNVQI